MKIEFSGAARNVTGSKHLIHLNGKKILLDCGLFQGRRKISEKWNRMFPFEAEEIDYMVLSHAHMDHCGAIPLLVKLGFDGPIYCTHATRDLCAIMLRDSGFIHEKDAEFHYKKTGEKVEPLYTVADAERCISNFRSINYHQRTRLFKDVYFTFHDAGHILGSAMEEWEIFDEDTKQHIRFGFTGDLGRKCLPILQDREQMENLDFLITESTYGNRLHDEIAEVEVEFAAKITEAYERGGKIIIPAFAMGRTQEILYMFKKLMADEKIPHIPIFVDSPLARKATEVFSIHQECFDDEMVELMDQGVDPFYGDGVQFTQSVEESKALNLFPGSCVIISASGMCEFGRIRHHLANHLGNEKNLLLIVGFQAENTLGRKLVEKESPVNIFGDPHEVLAEVQIYNAFSGHADQKGLLEFASKAGDLKNIFLVHGEEKSQRTFINELKKLDNVSVDTLISAPVPGEIHELTTDMKFVKTNEFNEASADFYRECEGEGCLIES